MDGAGNTVFEYSIGELGILDILFLRMGLRKLFFSEGLRTLSLSVVLGI